MGSELYQNLSKRGIFTYFQNVNNTYSYTPGCVNISREGHPINKEGNSVDNITLYGTPTEGITFDNDTLFRNRNNFASIWARETIYDIVKFCVRELVYG